MTTTRMIVLVVAVLVAGCGESGPVTNFGAGGSTSMNGGSPGSTGGAAMAAGGSNPSGTGGTVQPGTGGNIGAGGAITTGTGGVSGTGASMGTGGKPSTTGTGGAPQGGSSGTGGKPVTTGGTTGTGSNTGTGGATPGTGGKPATGTGGATPGTGGMITSTGGAPLGTGGNVGTGGMIASTGGNTGTGGMITSTGGAPANTGGAPGTGGTMPMMTPFSCSGFDTEFPFPGRVWDIASFGATNTYAVGEEVGQTQIGHLVHWNGNTATEQTLPVPANSWVVALYSVWGSSSNDVWAGGYIRTQLSGAPDGVGPVTPAVYHRVNGGAWQRDTTISFGSNVKTVVSITGSSASDVFVTAKVWDGDANEDVVIFRKNGSSWTQMSLPAHTLPTRIVRLAIISGKLYAVGYRLTGDPLANDAIQGILWLSLIHI